MSLPTIPRQVLSREKQLAELLLILLNMYSGGLIDRSRYLELGQNLVRGASEDVLGLVNASAKRENLPVADAAALALLLTRVQGDLSQQIADLDAGADPAEIRTRLEQTAAYVPWTTYSESMKSIASKMGFKLRWITALDEFVCLECAARHGVVYEPQELIGIPPLHPSCRCYVEFVI